MDAKLERKNSSPYMARTPKTPRAVPNLRHDQRTPVHPFHYILHAGFYDGDERRGEWMGYEDLIRVYKLRKEPFISRFGLDVLDEPGAIHLYAPLAGEDPMKHKAEMKRTMRRSKTYRKIIRAGTLYQRTKYPVHNISLGEEEL